MAQMIAKGTDSHTVQIETAVQQLCKGQDATFTGDGINGVIRWAMLNDGHGTHSTINFIRGISPDKMTEIVCGDDPVRALAKLIDESGCVGNESSGATVVILRLYSDRMECITSGDSQFVLFVDGVLVHVGVEHTLSNFKEQTRLKALNPRIEFVQGVNIHAVSDSHLRQVVSNYAAWEDGSMLACTQALGHNSKTGYAPDVQTFNLTPGSTFKFIQGSDGLFDMFNLKSYYDLEILRTKSCQEICDIVASRWKQPWIATDLQGRTVILQFDQPEHFDDVSVIVWDLVPM